MVDIAFADLIAPLGVDNFLADYWERRYYHARREEGTSKGAAIRQLFPFDEADRVLAIQGPRFKDAIRLTSGGQPIPEEEYSAGRSDGLIDFNTAEVLRLYATGATITLNRVQQFCDPLAHVCQEVSRFFGAHVSANIYITPPNSQGFAAHSDTHDVVLLQTEGSKAWWLERELTYLATPKLRNSVSDPLAGDDWDFLRLVQGEALYIPRGVVHEGVAGDCHSLHITLGIHPYTWGDLMRDVVLQLEREESIFRESACLPDGSLRRSGVVASKVSELLGSAGVLAELAGTRTQDFRDVSHRGEFARLTVVPDLSPSTKVRARDDLGLQVRSIGDEVELRFGFKALAFPSYVAPQLAAIVEGSPVALEDMPDGLDQDGKLVLLRRLLAEGVIEIC